MNALTGLGRLPALDLQDRAAARPEQMIPMPGAPILPMPAHIVEAAERASVLPWGRDTAGTPELKRALSKTLLHAGVSADPEREILVTHGASQALSVALGALLEPGDEVIVPSPSYFFDGAIVRAGGAPVHVPCDAARGWALNLERLEAAITARSRALLVCNPVNPTGRLHTAEEIDALVALAEANGLFLISDESFSHYVYEGRHVPMLSRKEASDRLIGIQSLSKNYAFASWRIGYVIAAPEVLARIRLCFEWDSINVGPVPQAAATAALTGERDWLDQVLAEYPRKRDALIGYLRAAGFPADAPQAGASLLVDLSATGLQARALETRLFSHRIAAIAGDAFAGPPDHVRLMFGGTSAHIDQLGAALADLGEETKLGSQKGTNE